MRKGLAVAALAVFAAFIPAASASVHVHVVATVGDAVPNGTLSAVFEGSPDLNVAHGGVVYFEGTVNGSNQGWLYRWQNDKVSLVTQMVSQYIAGDDLGNLAWYDPGSQGDKCNYSVLAPGASTPMRTGCNVSTSGSFTLMAGNVYYIAGVPSPPYNFGDAGVYEGSTLLAILPSGAGGLWNDGAGGIYTEGQGGSILKLVGSSFMQAAPPGSFGFVGFAPGHVLTGSNVQAYDYTPSGRVDLTAANGRVWIGNSGDVVLHQNDQLSLDKFLRLESDGAHPIFGVGSKTIDGWKVIGLYSAFATAHDDDGTTAAIGTITKGSAQKIAVLAAIDECTVPKPVSPIPLDQQDTRDASYEGAHSLDGFQAQVKKSITKIRADEQAHPAHKAADNAEINELKQQLDAGNGSFRSVSAQAQGLDDNTNQLLSNAKCGWLEDGATTLKKAAQGKYAKEISQLGDRLVDLKKVLNGEVKPGSDEANAVLETNLVALGERFGGDNGGKLTKKAANLYKVLTGQMKQKDLPKEVRSEIVDLAKILGGKNAGELTQQIVTLVDVLHGDLDADKQYEVLKESVSALATRIGVEGLLKSPQARAAMLGFEIGKAFADRMSVDLQLVADRELKLACLNALAEAQNLGHSIGEIDYTKKTAVFTDKNSSHPGWSCTIRPEDDVAGYDNHTLIEAYLPPKIFLGFQVRSAQDKWFDPAF